MPGEIGSGQHRCGWGIALNRAKPRVGWVCRALNTPGTLRAGVTLDSLDTPDALDDPGRSGRYHPSDLVRLEAPDHRYRLSEALYAERQLSEGVTGIGGVGQQTILNSAIRTAGPN